MDRIGLIPLQKAGFLATAFFFFLLAILQPNLTTVPIAYLIMYGLTFFFQNFGANGTTYIVPSVIYITEQKATCHGISAAAGKLGAILGAEILVYLTGSFCPGENCTDASTEEVNSGLRVTFAVCGFLSVIGYIWTVVFLSDVKPLTVDESAKLHNDHLIDHDDSPESSQKSGLLVENQRVSDDHNNIHLFYIFTHCSYHFI